MLGFEPGPKDRKSSALSIAPIGSWFRKPNFASQTFKRFEVSEKFANKEIQECATCKHQKCETSVRNQRICRFQQLRSALLVFGKWGFDSSELLSQKAWKQPTGKSDENPESAILIVQQADLGSANRCCPPFRRCNFALPQTGIRTSIQHFHMALSYVGFAAIRCGISRPFPNT